jgi:hypothetical protein
VLIATSQCSSLLTRQVISIQYLPSASTCLQSTYAALPVSPTLRSFPGIFLDISLDKSPRFVVGRFDIKQILVGHGAEQCFEPSRVLAFESDKSSSRVLPRRGGMLLR